MSVIQRLPRSPKVVASKWQVMKSCPKSTSVNEVEIDADFKDAKSYSEIPGPKPLPIIGNNWRFLPIIGNFSWDVHEFTTKFRNDYGDISKLSKVFGKRDAVFLYEPNAIEKMYRNEGPWPIRDGNPSLTHYRDNSSTDLYKDAPGLVNSQFEEWQKMRSKVNQTMMQPRNAMQYIQPIANVADDFVKRIKSIRNEILEMPADFHNELQKWALESITVIALDTRMGCFSSDLKPDSDQQQMINCVSEMFTLGNFLDNGLPLWKYFRTPMYKKYEKALDVCTEITLKYIKKSMEKMNNKSDKHGELSVLEKLIAKDPKVASVMAIDMMIAGIDTTSNAVSVILYYLAKNPDKQRKLQEEIDKIISKNEQITAESLNEMKYLKSCIKESLRMTPIISANVRTTVKDIVLCGYKIPKGTDVVSCTWNMCNEEKFFPEPQKFIPERWIKGSPQASNCHPFVNLPFGFGPRMCIGRRFAELEMEVVIMKLMKSFNIEFNYGELQFQNYFITSPLTPLQFKMTDRN